MADAARKRERMCIGCGERFDKRDLFRIVRTTEGTVTFDATGRAAGRGAYVCSGECLERALGKGKLGRALRCAIGKDQMAVIASELAGAAQVAPER